MIAITGASGGLGFSTLTALAAHPVVAIVRNRARLETRIRTTPEVSISPQTVIRQADYNDPASLQDAFQGVTKLLQISASDIGEVARKQEDAVVRAAQTAGVQHMVYTSTLYPEADARFRSAAQCRRTEDRIRNSGMTYTFFRNSMYFETIPMFAGDGWEEGMICLPVGEGKVSFVSREDIAVALAAVLTSDGHENAAYNITGEQAFTFAQVAGMLTITQHRAFCFQDMPLENWKAGLPPGAMPPDQADWFLSLLDGIRKQEFSVVSDTLATLLNRAPQTLFSYLSHV